MGTQGLNEVRVLQINTVQHSLSYLVRGLSRTLVQPVREGLNALLNIVLLDTVYYTVRDGQSGESWLEPKGHDHQLVIQRVEPEQHHEWS